jgi:hypothetical protein
MPSIINNYSTLNDEHNEEDLHMYPIKKSFKLALLIIIIILGNIQFSIRFL